MQYYQCIIYGNVQGVSYRKCVSQALMRRQFRGYIRNLENGTVEVVAEIFDDDFNTFLEILKEGSPLSRVDDIACKVIDNARFETDRFEIRY